MRSIAFADFLIGVGILFRPEGLLFAASPSWMRRAMKSALATPDNILRAVGLGSAVAGLILIWFVRRCPLRPGLYGHASTPPGPGFREAAGRFFALIQGADGVKLAGRKLAP